MSNAVPPAAPEVAERHTILIVDDRPSNLGFVVDHLESLGHHVVVAQGGAEALRRVDFARPDLILLDAMMPDVDGFEVCRRLAARGDMADLPVIFMTALKQTDTVLAAFALGAVDYVTKPLQVDEVAARVAAHLQLRAARRRLEQQADQLRRVRADLLGEAEVRSAELRFLARRDPLTGLPNRHSFRDALAAALARAAAGGGSVGVLQLGLDRFREVNDGLGRARGDRLLVRCAALLEGALGGGERVARIGGDEFAILVEADGDNAGLGLLARRLLRLFAGPLDLGDYELVVGCSIGVGQAAPGAGADDLLCEADTAMCRAKADGGNRYRRFTPEMGDGARRRLAVGNALRHAVRDGELSLHYQPRTRVGGGAAVGMEALLRWDGKLLGAVAPAEFIPLAEQNGLILPIGEWVLGQACHQAQQWRRRFGDAPPVAVNLSARQFRDADLVRVVGAALAASGLPPHLLELELTEGMLMYDARRAARTLAALKGLGVRLAVDDFGTGYSSLSYLKSFPLDYLKIDRSFVAGLPADRDDGAIVGAIIAMAHSLGLKVIAEGVETAGQLAFLRAQRCDEAQGYYLSRPLPAPAMEAYLARPAAPPARADLQGVL